MRAPYGMELAPYGVINYVLFVRNKGSQDDWIWVNDLPEEKIQSLRERREREKLAEQQVVASAISSALDPGTVVIAGGA